ncbi:family 20 glycosylhydrolase [Mucilaginibacter sp. UR6-1]|uniref:family 20 glycosylhydrolase n=1 Tax=Mucilaginibacter sp. UR6-1 TaxID=1435643 RepID=UPI001E34C3F0|nr:family 20 glycosylhydrolase [Mucilaginibacter sp. UR6-1]
MPSLSRYFKIFAFLLGALTLVNYSVCNAYTLTPVADTTRKVQRLGTVMPVRGFAIGAPRPKGLDDFIKFINNELGPRHVNTLILRVDYAYQFKSHPELVDSFALSKNEVKKIVKACRDNRIDIVCQINLLGHQSWANKVGKLLKAYPQFDETPGIIPPANYKWPNADSLYCKSYCPLHPDVHKVVFDVVDEICDVFETKAFHAGMDEVFYIGHPQCPRCSGKDKAALYAGEVKLIRDHLAQKGRSLWIWGDRLLDARLTGLGIWEASMNNTDRAIDLIPKDVFICDWHYDRPDQTAVLFALKGMDVATCTWRSPQIALQQTDDILRFRKNSTPEMKDHFRGMILTIWSRNDQFLDEFKQDKHEGLSQAETFRQLFAKINSL